MENTNKAYMALLEYDVDNVLVGENDKDMLTEFMDYNGSTCICEAISEIAEGNVSVYNSDICENTWNLYSSGSYEDASNEGLMGDSNDLIKTSCVHGSTTMRNNSTTTLMPWYTIMLLPIWRIII